MAIVKWVLALGVGAFLIFFGIAKFAGGAHIFPYIEYKATALDVPLAGLAYPLGNYATGALELVAGVLLILPMTRLLGSKIAVLPFFGAFLIHLSPLLGVVTPDGYADPKPVEALSAGGPFVLEHFSSSASAGLFTFATIGLIASFANLVIQTRGKDAAG